LIFAFHKIIDNCILQKNKTLKIRRFNYRIGFTEPDSSAVMRMLQLIAPLFQKQDLTLFLLQVAQESERSGFKNQ